MLRRLTLSLAILLGASAALLPGTHAQNPYRLKPGAKGKVCTNCHADFEETLKQPFVHTPVKAGDCADCHDPHTSRHGKLLAADTGSICLTCHAEVVPDGARSVHASVIEGGCVRCHDPHAAKNKDNLLQAGNDLCYGCHKEMSAAVSQAKFRHSPVERGCLGCHDPHASTKAPALLREEPPALCTQSCHRPDQPGFIKQHMGYPVAKASCTSCHDPHGSSTKGILWASVHAPVVNRMCAQCHADPASPQALSVKKSGSDLCRGCHNDFMNEVASRKRIHWPVVDDVGCMHCHTPHASRQAALLTETRKDLCASCHTDTLARLERSTVKHRPVEEGECVVCHSPHASDAIFLLKQTNVSDLCGSCHDWQRHSTHPIGEKIVDQRNKNLFLDCASCHRSHGSSHKYFAHFDTKQDLCVQCHQDLRR